MPAEYQTTCTIQDYGTKLARAHLHDWLILLLLIVLEGILLIIHPFYRFVGKDMMTDLRYPLKGNTVPFWAVPLYSMALPIVVFVLFYLRRRDVYDLHHATLGNIEQAFSTQIFPKILILLFMILETTGLLFAIFIAAVLTDAIKDSVGRPRPDFFWRCFPDGKDKYDALGNVICHGNRNVIREGHKSFPSGHTSWSFAGLGFLSLYLCGKIKVFDHKGHVWKLCLVIFPVLAAALVGVSRVDDYWHHWQDVFAGGLLGIVVAFFCYHQFFPPPYNMKGWGTYAYFQAMEDMREAEERQIAAGNDINSNVV